MPRKRMSTKRIAETVKVQLKITAERPTGTVGAVHL